MKFVAHELHAEEEESEAHDGHAPLFHDALFEEGHDDAELGDQFPPLDEFRPLLGHLLHHEVAHATVVQVDDGKLNPDGYKFNFYQDMTIGIRAPQTEQEAIHPSSSSILHSPSTIYTLDGRPVSQRPLPPGIYICRGRKLVVR